MADDKNKRLIQIQVLARVDADTDEKASVLGGTLARQIQANIPNMYEVVGVELQSTDAQVDQRSAYTAGTPAATKQDKDPTVLKT